MQLFHVVLKDTAIGVNRSHSCLMFASPIQTFLTRDKAETLAEYWNNVTADSMTNPTWEYVVTTSQIVGLSHSEINEIPVPF